MSSGPAQLRDWMRRRGVNQRETADLLGVTEVFLSQILNGHRNPGLANAVNIERTTGVAVESWLLNRLSESDEPESIGVRKLSIAKR